MLFMFHVSNSDYCKGVVFVAFNISGCGMAYLAK